MKNIDFVEEANPWSIYQLADGTKIKMRFIIKKFNRLPDLDERGNPQYNFDFIPVIDLTFPEPSILKDKLKKDLS